MAILRHTHDIHWCIVIMQVRQVACAVLFPQLRVVVL